MIPGATVATTAIYGKGAKFIDFFVPGIMSFVVFMLTTLLTLVSFVGERTGETLQRMLATPLRERDIVLGYAGAFSIVGIIQSSILLVVGILVFHIIIVGNVLLALMVIALLAFALAFLTLAVASLKARKE